MCIILFEIAIGNNLTELIPKLAVFAVAAFRLLPSVGKINSFITEISFTKPAVDAVYTELRELENEDRIEESTMVSKVDWKDKLEVKNLSFSYEKELTEVLSNVTISIQHGSAVGLIGPSGAGKTTFADLIMGLLKPTCGEISVDGKNIEENIRIWQKTIGYVPQSIYLSDDTIRGNVAFGLSEDDIDDDKIWNALKQAQLEEFVKASSDGIYTQVGDRGVGFEDYIMITGMGYYSLKNSLLSLVLRLIYVKLSISMIVKWLENTEDYEYKQKFCSPNSR